MPKTKRIERTFARLRNEECRPALVAFITAGDPDYQTSLDLACRLPGAGADIIELGMPFTDPMADGPAIQRSSLRALKSGQTMIRTLELVRGFRAKDQNTPIILMGYYNPIYSYGNERFLADAVEVGVDGLIIVDLPPELDRELCLPAMDAGLNFIRLATPTTDDERLPAVLANTSGFVYYVSIAGITGTRAPDTEKVRQNVLRVKGQTDLPVCVGFGVKTAQQVEAIGAFADGVVVGSALVNAIEENLDETGVATAKTIESVTSLVSELAAGLVERPLTARPDASGQAAPA